MNGFTFSPALAGSPADCWRPGSPYWPFSNRIICSSPCFQ